MSDRDRDYVNTLKEVGNDQPHHRVVARRQRTHADRASIGRGQRFHGKRTGRAVDRLNIVAHDKFQEIIDEANRGDSPIRLKQVILEAPSADDKKVSVQVESGAAAQLGLAAVAPGADPASVTAKDGSQTAPAVEPVFTTDAENRLRVW